jgi:hypothetical protein
MPFLVFAPCLGLNRAASSLSKGSLEEVDEQRLAASPDTDKSRFLTIYYAFETFLDARLNLMQRLLSTPLARKESHPLKVVIF